VGSHVVYKSRQCTFAQIRVMMSVTAEKGTFDVCVI
jgi:hypothetical protein